MKVYGIAKLPHPKCADTSFFNHHVSGVSKTRLMITRPHINRLIILAFMVLVGIALAYGIWARSVTGIILSLTSLGAGIHFLVLLAKAKKQMEQEQEEAV